MDEALKDLGDYIAAALPQDVNGIHTANGQLEVSVRADAIIKVLTFLRDDSNLIRGRSRRMESGRFGRASDVVRREC